ncbi:unnamed protein product [Parnassius mnemosyne]|uniref:Mitochondrial ribosomal protein S36 n=1 Tax=Parnassius mnemosyne TaxID=213953 RepID=A0AAV1KDD7_9NEOP
MVRVTTFLCRIPVIKFRKGGSAHSAGGSPSIPTTTSSAGAAPAANTAAVQAQHTAAMSTISDIDLPPRYRRAPLSQEEIDHINGGGIV